jgi:hypothetical protein
MADIRCGALGSRYTAAIGAESASIDIAADKCYDKQ